MGRMLVIRNRRQNCKKSPDGLTILYKEKKEKKKLQYLMPIVFRISGDILHTPSKLCFQSTGNKYHNILDAYAGYKKQKAKLQKKSRRAHYFIYKELKIKKYYNT